MKFLLKENLSRNQKNYQYSRIDNVILLLCSWHIASINVTFSFDQWNLISWYLRSNWQLVQIWGNSLESDLSYCDQEAKNKFVMTLTFDPWTPNCNEFIEESKGIFVPNLKRFPPGTPEILSSQGKKHVLCEVTTTLTFDPHNLISSYLSSTERLYQIWEIHLRLWYIVLTRIGRTIWKHNATVDA